MKSIQVQDLGRLQQIVRVLAKNGFGQVFTSVGWMEALPSATDEVRTRPFARRFRQALIDLGPTWIKLGQVLSVRPDIMPADVILELQMLQDKVPAMDVDDIHYILEEELGLPIEEVFEEFDPIPLGSASIAQVHRAILLNGQQVAVKLQRRGIEKKIRSDIHILYSLAQWFEGSRIPGLYTPTAIVREFDIAIHNELDFTQELQAGERFYKNFKSNKDVIVPQMYSRWSTRRMLVMDFIDAKPLSTRLNIDKVTEKSRSLAHKLMQMSYEQVFVHGFFHGDPHPGNILVTEDDKLALLDFGLTGTLTGSMQDTLISAFTSLVFRDAETLAMTTYRAGATAQRVDIREFTAEIERLMTKYHGASLDEVTENPANMMELIQVSAKYQITLPPEFAVLSRCFGLLEGTVRGLLPGIDIVEEVKPYAQKLVTSRLSPDRVAVDVARAIVQLQGHLRDLPTHVTQVLMDLERGDISFEMRNPDTQAMLSEIRIAVLRLSLALFAATITLGAFIFLGAWSPSPLYVPVFGLVGLLMAIGGASLFGALGIHVLFARYLSITFWRKQIVQLLRFFSWRKRT
jgi:ubiquinone biosynthesis protein